MHRKIEEDPAYKIVSRIMSTPVPLQSELSNPFNSNKRKKKLVLNADDKKDNTLSDDVTLWTVKSFVDYFADSYYKKNGGYYKKTYSSDNVVFNEIGKFMASNGLQKQEWTKKFIDWSFENHDTIVKKSNYFLPTTIKNYLNHFYQEEVMPKVEEDSIERTYFESTILEDIKVADEDGKASEIYIRFGIPIASSYFIQIRGISSDIVEKGINNFLSKLAQGDLKAKEKIGLVLQKSIMRSPYPQEFSLLDWRDKFETFAKLHTKENWWRDKDYSGKPLSEYQRLIKRD